MNEDVIVGLMRVAIREELAAAGLSTHRRAGPRPGGAGLDRLGEVLAKAEATPPLEGGCVTVGWVLAALGVEGAQRHKLAWAVTDALRARGWTAGPRMRVGGRTGPRVTPYYPGAGAGASGAAGAEEVGRG